MENIWDKKSFTKEELAPEVKHELEVKGHEVEMQRCENCLSKALLPDGTCLQCGVSEEIGS